MKVIEMDMFSKVVNYFGPVLFAVCGFFTLMSYFNDDYINSMGFFIFMFANGLIIIFNKQFHFFLIY